MEQRNTLPTGLDEIDRLGLGPTRHEVHLFRAPVGKGKTWWLVQIGLTAILRNQAKVLHVSVESSEQRLSRRYLQCLCTAATFFTPVPCTTITTDDKSGHVSLHCQDILPARILTDPQMQEKIEKEFDAVRDQMRGLHIKDFPTGHLTVEELERFLDNLKRESGFVPDLILLDNPDMMTLPSHSEDAYLIGLASLYRDLQGLAQQRHVAVATVTSPRRESLGDAGAREDKAALLVPSTVLTYSQTPEEAECAVARLEVTTARHTPGGQTFLISQCYATGEFCLQCVPVPTGYDPSQPVAGVTVA